MSTHRAPAPVNGRLGTLSVATLYPAELPAGLLPAAVGGRTLAVRHACHVDSFAARNAKADGAEARAVRGIETPPGPLTRAALAGAEVVLALDLPLDLAVLAPRLRWVQGYGAGVGQLVRSAAPCGAAVTSAAGVGAEAIAEFVMARLLQVTRRLRELDRRQRRCDWSAPPGDVLAGRGLLVVGLGAIGRRVAALGRAFGMRVLAVRRRPELGGTDATDEVHPAGTLPALLPRVDVVVLCAPSTGETAGLIGARELDLMRPDAILVNVARGSLVDEPALVRALARRRIGAAVLDVTAVEPLPAESPLWTMDNAYLSPHSSTSPDGYRDRLLELFRANLERYVAGRPLLNAVDASLFPSGGTTEGE